MGNERRSEQTGAGSEEARTEQEGERQRGAVGCRANKECRVGVLQSGQLGNCRNQHRVPRVVAGASLVPESVARNPETRMLAD